MLRPFRQLRRPRIPRGIQTALALLAMTAIPAAPLCAQTVRNVALHSGAGEVLRHGGDRLEAGWELHFAPRRFRLLGTRLPELTPVAGATATSAGSIYAYGGFRTEVPLGRRWLLIPSWATGLYLQGEGMDLGGPLEFRSAIELSYRLGPRTFVGFSFYHLSNAGLHRLNPGTESLVFTYSTGLR